MKTAVTFSEFCDRFSDMGRNDKFTYRGKKALFSYLEQYEEDTGEEIELDVIALCCDYSEYSSAKECIEDCGYGFKPDEESDEDNQEKECLEYLQENTTVIEFQEGIIIQQS